MTCPACGETSPPSRYFEAQGLAKCGACEKLVDPRRGGAPSSARLPQASSGGAVAAPSGAGDEEPDRVTYFVCLFFALPIFLAAMSIVVDMADELLLKTNLITSGSLVAGRVESVQYSESGSSDRRTTYSHITVTVTDPAHGTFRCRTTLQGKYDYSAGTRLPVYVHPSTPAYSRLETWAWQFFGPVLMMIMCLGFGWLTGVMTMKSLQGVIWGRVE